MLIVGNDREERARLVRLLSSSDHTVVDVAPDRADAEMRELMPRILIAVVGDGDEPDMIRALAALDRSGSIYLMAVIPEGAPQRMIPSVIAAGCHDVLCRPYGAEELRARVDAHRRLRTWATSAAIQQAVAQRAAQGLIGRLRSWDYLGDVVGDDLATFVGRPLVVEEGWLRLTESFQLASISMTLPLEQLELVISVVADATTRRWLGTNLLGDPTAGDDMLDDVMREMANTAAGALKRAALCEGPLLSTGIPIDGRSLPRRESGARCWTMVLEGQAVIAVIGEVRRRANRKIPAQRLAEGMVVVDDLRNSAGVLLLTSGTRLTATAVRRLGEMVDLGLIEVAA